MVDTTVGRERAQEFSIVRWASAVAFVMVNNATSKWVPLANADQSPTIARNGNGDGIRVIKKKCAWRTPGVRQVCAGCAPGLAQMAVCASA